MCNMIKMFMTIETVMIFRLSQSDVNERQVEEYTHESDWPEADSLKRIFALLFSSFSTKIPLFNTLLLNGN